MVYFNSCKSSEGFLHLFRHKLMGHVNIIASVIHGGLRKQVFFCNKVFRKER